MLCFIRRPYESLNAPRIRVLLSMCYLPGLSMSLEAAGRRSCQEGSRRVLGIRLRTRRGISHAGNAPWLQ